MNKTNNLLEMTSPTVTAETLLKEPINIVNEPSFCVHWLAIQGQKLYIRGKNSQISEYKHNVNIEVRRNMKSNLSKESQQYLEMLIKAINNEIYEILPNIYNSLRQDSGLNQLVPYIVHFLMEVSKTELDSNKPNVKCFSKDLGQKKRRY